MIIWKIWKGGLNPEVTYYVEKESLDEALAEVRKIDPKVNTAQPCTDEEAAAIRERGWNS